MQKIIVIAFCIILANFIFLSVGFSQSSVGIQAIVPVTEKNINVKPESAIKTTTKENKYQYFFEKYLSAQQRDKNATDIKQNAQSAYDRVASWGLMWGLLFILAAFFLFILRIIDHYLIPYSRVKIKHLSS